MNRKDSGKEKKSIFAEDLIENLPIGMMLLDKNGKIIRMNKKQEEVSQVSRGKILGKTFEEAFPRTLEQGLKEPYSKLLKKGFPFDVIIDRYIPQYYSKPMTYHARGASFSRNRYFILMHELEEELYQEKRLVERRTKELQESKNFLESLIDSSPSIIVSTDLRDRILIFNKSAQEIFNYKEDDVMKRKINFLFKTLPPNKNRGKNGAYPFTLWEVLCIKKNQSTFPGSLLVSNIKDSVGKTIAKLYLLNDLTDKKEMEERLILSEKLALYSELMGGIAHQLNNPLIGVVNFSEMLLKEMEDEDPRKKLAQTISRGGKECLRITTSVLNCIKDPHLTFSRTDINEVLTNSIDSLKEQFKHNLKDISILSKFDPKILPILGDSIQLKQCFLNILINAIQAMQNGKGNLEVKTEYDEKKNEVNILFSDTGKGIPKELMNKIFLPYFSLQKDPERHGLGLSFAYQIVKNHSGHIRVESEIGRGSIFTIILPAS
jgi:PAS domain S-box-containing protein